MNTRTEIIDRLIALRGGVVTTQELVDAGIPRGSIQLETKHGWTKMGHGIWYAKAGEPDFHAWIEAGRIAFGDDSLIGGGASLFVRGFIDRPPETIDFWIPDSKSFYPRKGSPLKPRRDYLDRSSRRDTNAPFSSIADSLCDFLNDTKDPVVAANAIINCRKRAPRAVQEIHSLADSRKRLKHRALLAYLLDCQPAFDSVLEYMWVVNVEVPHNIPPATRQWRCPDGFLRDGVWEHLKAIIELDGDAYHNNQTTMKRDRAKNNAATRRGFTTYRFGYADIFHNACATAATLSESIPGLNVSPCSDRCWVQKRP